MSVVIRMKMMGRKHRAFFRICATDSRFPRDGRIIEEIGTYDPKVPETDARVTLNHERVTYWLGVGAQPSEKCHTLIKKYGPNGTHLAQQTAAREKLAMPKVVPPAPEAVYIPPVKSDEPAAPAAAEAAPAAEATPEVSAEGGAEASTEAKAE